MSLRLSTAAALAAGAALCVAVPARAHDESLSHAEISVTEHEVKVQIAVDWPLLANVLHLPIAPDPATLAQAGPAAARYLAEALALRAEDRALVSTPGAFERRDETHDGGKRAIIATQTLIYRSEAPLRALHATVNLFPELGARHRTLVHVRWGTEARQFVCRGATPLVLVAGQLTPSATALAWDFLRWGAEHIFRGFDHLAFLLALLLAAVSLRQLLAIVTAFTVSHSITLLLAATRVVSFSSRWAEALIAASIVFVAVENLGWLGRRRPQRWIVAFVFGLVHGLGFATELRNRLAEAGGRLILPVLSFNLGVELGQIAVVAMVFPILMRIRRAPTDAQRRQRQQRLLRMGSVPILLVGLFWTIDRLLG